jgi:hypothetical protein
MALVGKAYKATVQVIGTVVVVAAVAVALISGAVSLQGFGAFVGIAMALAAFARLCGGLTR